jgi:hypothetical protein
VQSGHYKAKGNGSRYEAKSPSERIDPGDLFDLMPCIFFVDDPIFSGLAISSIFGICVSTLLTLVVIPVLYYAFMRTRAHRLRA